MSTEEKLNTFADDDRRILCLEATWEISAITTLIQMVVDHSQEIDPTALRGVMKRMAYLNELIMSATGDEIETTEHLRARFN